LLYVLHLSVENYPLTCSLLSERLGNSGQTYIVMNLFSVTDVFKTRQKKSKIMLFVEVRSKH